MIFKFEPIYQERVWGGQLLKTKLKRNIPSDVRIGESWDLVDRDDINSRLLHSFKNSQSLRSLIHDNPTLMMGPHWSPDQKFPILVKWLDCSERLSLQVHPPKQIAQKLSGEPKTENWYVAHAADNAGLFAGFRKGTTKENFKEAIANGTAENCCHRINSEEGVSILIESGRIHAIDSGNLILEIQQNSDTTYRVFDWDRNGLNGIPRELHIENSMQSIDFNDFEPSVLKTAINLNPQILANCNEFRIRKFNLLNGQEFQLKEKNVDCSIIHLISGKINIGKESIEIGEHGLSPFSEGCIIKATHESEILITDRFNKPT
jgi:mannose-6-phosphate isomerase